MSYMSASENIGFNVIPQNISEASCATQYKMAVDNVAGVCASEASPYISNGTSTDQTYMIPHINDNFFQSKFKIDPNDLYTFHDSDIIASEVTVANSEETVIEVADIKPNVDSPKKERIKFKNVVTNGVVKKSKKEMTNGHGKPVSKPASAKSNAAPIKNNGKTQPKVPKARSQAPKEPKANSKPKAALANSSTMISPPTAPSLTGSISAANTSLPPSDPKAAKSSSAVTFLDVFMREQGLDDVKVKLEPPDSPPPLVLLPPSLIPTMKEPSVLQAQKKTTTTVTTQSSPSVSRTGSAGKTASKPRRGRGPTQHEALQRISRRAAAAPVRPWHAPGHELFDLRPLTDTPPNRYRRLEASSDEDEHVPSFDAHLGLVEEGAVENREQRIALRKAALRRQLALAKKSLRHARDFRRPKELVATIKNHMELEQSSRVPQFIINELLMKRGMTSVLTSKDKKQLRAHGWSGGERLPRQACSHEHCAATALPCAAHCARHAASSPAVRLFAGCSAVFAGGARCRQLLVPLQEGAPLCAHHRAKRDNYDRISKEPKPKKVVGTKAEVESKKAKRRRRPPPPRPNGAAASLGANHQVITVNGASALVRADAAWEATENALAHEHGHINDLEHEHDLENEHDFAHEHVLAGDHQLPADTLGADQFIVTDGCDVQELEVEHVASDDILVDPSVLSQIPDEEFTEFFNQAGGVGAFEESSELTRALEAVLDERTLDERALDALAECAPPAPARGKMNVGSSISVEMSSPAPS